MELNLWAETEDVGLAVGGRFLDPSTGLRAISQAEIDPASRNIVKRDPNLAPRGP